VTLVSFWFLVIAVVWTGFFVLEGFDFGVGMLHAVVGRDEPGRRAAINTIGPLWDGNEVWLIVAGAAMFAAFPGWYATMFSGFYLALVLLLGALMARGTSFEYRGKRDSATWRRTWSALMIIGSVLAPFVIGIALGDLLHGLPINAGHQYTGSFWTLLQPYGIFTGVTFLAICVTHGATFLALKTAGEVRLRAVAVTRASAPVTALVVLAFAIWTHSIAGKGVLINPIEIIAVLAVLAAGWLVYANLEGWAFAATTVAMATTVLSIFSELYPRLMISSTSPANNLTIHNSASGSYSLTVMTVVVAIFLPVVLAYTAWSYYVFRRRLSDKDFVRRPEQPAQPRDRAAGDRAGHHRTAATSATGSSDDHTDG
jgi:cytochrome d ubiquinol oxidase subunit II